MKDDIDAVINDLNIKSWNSDIELQEIKDNIKYWIDSKKPILADNTYSDYRRNWVIFSGWCDIKEYSSIPAGIDTILEFIKDHEHYFSPSSLVKMLSIISIVHEAAGYANPVKHRRVADVKYKLRNIVNLGLLSANQCKRHIRRRYGSSINESLDIEQISGQSNNRTGRAHPIRRMDLYTLRKTMIVNELIETSGLPAKEAKSIRRINGHNLFRARDLALIHLAYDALLHVKEVIGIRVEDLNFDNLNAPTVTIIVNQRKRTFKSYTIELSHETKDIINRWLLMSNICTGPVFCRQAHNGIPILNDAGEQIALTTQGVTHIYKKVALALGMNKRLVSCNSTRIGAVYDMNDAEVPLQDIMEAGRWKKADSPLRYIVNTPERGFAMQLMESDG